MINKKWKCHYRCWIIRSKYLNVVEQTKMTIKLPNSKSHKINLQLFNKESNLDTLWYLFIVNSRNNHWKSHRKNSCKQRRYVYNWGDFSFSTLFPSLRHRNNWQDIASTDILCSDHAWPACRGGRLASLEASLVQCFAFYKTSSKTSGSNVFEKHRTPLPDGGRVDVAFELPPWLPWLSFTQADVEGDPGPFGELVVLPWLTHSTWDNQDQ